MVNKGGKGLIRVGKGFTSGISAYLTGQADIIPHENIIEYADL